MLQLRRSSSFSLPLLGLLLSAGCATPPPPPSGNFRSTQTQPSNARTVAQGGSQGFNAQSSNPAFGSSSQGANTSSGGTANTRTPSATAPRTSATPNTAYSGNTATGNAYTSNTSTNNTSTGTSNQSQFGTGTRNTSAAFPTNSSQAQTSPNTQNRTQTGTTTATAARPAPVPANAWWLSTPPPLANAVQAIGTGPTRDAAVREAQAQIAGAIVTMVQDTIDAQAAASTPLIPQEKLQALVKRSLQQQIAATHLTGITIARSYFDNTNHYVLLQVEITPLVNQARAKLGNALAQIDALFSLPVPKDLRTRLALAGEASKHNRQARTAAYILLALNQTVNTEVLWPKLASVESAYRKLLGDAVFVVKGDALSNDLKESVRGSLQAMGAKVFWQYYSGKEPQISLNFASASKELRDPESAFAVAQSAELAVGEGEAEWYQQRWVALGGSAVSRAEAVKTANASLLEQIMAQDNLSFLGW